MPNSAFFNLFHKQKKFSETTFTKLPSNPYPVRITKKFTNYFSVICLEQRNIDLEIIHAIASHGPHYFGVNPETKMDKMLYAFDELSGLIHAYSLMRPGGYGGMELKGVKKRLKEKSFAANVSREEIQEACDIACLGIDEVIQFILLHQAKVHL